MASQRKLVHSLWTAKKKDVEGTTMTTTFQECQLSSWAGGEAGSTSHPPFTLTDST
jgi:hypothetical protein